MLLSHHVAPSPAKSWKREPRQAALCSIYATMSEFLLLSVSLPREGCVHTHSLTWETVRPAFPHQCPSQAPGPCSPSDQTSSEPQGVPKVGQFSTTVTGLNILFNPVFLLLLFKSHSKLSSLRTHPINGQVECSCPGRRHLSPSHSPSLPPVSGC